jgi:hypothetical protein
MRLEKLPALSKCRKLLQQQGELRTNPGHSYSNSTTGQVVTQASLENTEMIIAIVAGVIAIIGSIIAVIRYLYQWQVRQKDFLGYVHAVSRSVAYIQCDTCWCHELSQSQTPVSDGAVQDKDMCVMQAQAAPVAPTDGSANAPTVAPKVQAAFYKPPEMLEDIVTAMLAETKHHVFLSGAPGIGKSAMAAAVHARCMKVCASLIR